jgi:P27 family predicted phage terminase small subunit
MVFGHVIYGEKGQSRSPQSTSFVALNGELHRMSSELGLSPSSRGKLIANPDVKENDPFAEWLKKRGAN